MPTDPDAATAAEPTGRITRRRAAHRRAALAGAFLLAAALGLAACSGGPSTSSGPGSAAAGSSTVTTHLVIQDFAFHPADLTVSPGATITVTNRDSVAHTFTARGGAFDTGDIAPGATVKVTAPSKPGSYPYLCGIHQYMTGTLTVAAHA